MKKSGKILVTNLLIYLLLFLWIKKTFASDSVPSIFESISHQIKHNIFRLPKNLFTSLFRLIVSHLVYIGWGLVILGSLFGIFLLILYINKKPKESPVPYIQTNQPRAMEPTNQDISGTILYVTHPNGYRENIPMYYDRMIIGTHPSCQIVLQDGKISQQQAEIYTQEGRYFVRDLGSASGTFVNGALIEGVVELFQGYYVQMGDSTIQL
jgi:hypothetical protein